MPRRIGWPSMRRISKNTPAKSSATSRPGRVGEGVLLSPANHGARPVAGRQRGAGGRDPRRGRAARGHAGAGHRERRRPPAHPAAHAAAHPHHPGIVRPRGERRFARARRVARAGLRPERAGGRDSRFDRRRAHRLAGVHVRGRERPDRAHPARRSGGAPRRLMERAWAVAGALSAFIAVAAGAFGAHALRSRLTPDLLAVFETAARYQMYHALALIAVAFALSRWPSPAARTAGWLFVAGTLLF